MRIPIGKVAQHLGIDAHHSTIIRWHQKGVTIGGKRTILPATRYGCRLYVDEDDLQTFIAKLNDRPVQLLKEKNIPAMSAETGRILDKHNV